MTRISHGFPSRIHACRWACFVALAGLSLTATAQVTTTPIYPIPFNPNFGGFTFEYQGSGATARPATELMRGNTTVPSGVGNTYTVPGGAAAETAGGKVYLYGSNDFDVPNSGGKTVSTTVRAPVNPTSMGKALARFGAKALPIMGTALALRDLLNELEICHYLKSGGVVQYCEFSEVETAGFTVVGYPDSFGGTKDAACRDARRIMGTSAPYYGVVGNTCYPTDQSGYTVVPKTSVQKNGPPIDIHEDTLADRIAQKSGWPTSSTIAQAVVEAMRNPQVMNDPATTIKVDRPTVTGPSSVVTGTTTTTNPDGSVTTRTNTTNITYNGPTVSTTTTTVTNNTTTGGTTTTTTTTSTENKTEDPCKTDPNRAGCAKLDTVEGEIPKKNFTVTYVAENLFGGGSCPADKYATIGGRSMKVWDWQQSCQYLLNYVKPLLLALAAFAAYFILSPGKNE